jgi:DNA-binding IclR family transcriptional regulator
MGDKTPPNMRLLRIVEILSKHGKLISPTELNAELGLPKQSIHRLCNIMIEAGFLEKSERKLRPSTRLLSIASGLGRLGVEHMGCHQILRNVSAKFGETVNLVRPEKAGMMYIDRVETNWPFRVLLPIGTHVPFHCTASGKTYLASLPKAKRAAIISSLDLVKLTDNTIISADRLEDEIAQIRQQNFALDRGEFYDGMVAVAVPILDNEDRYFGALAVHGPSNRFNIDEAVTRLEVLVSGAQKINNVMFC